MEKLPMALNRQECLTLLEAKFRESFSQIDNISKLTTDARWAEKYHCIDEVGGMIEVSNTLQQIQLNKTENHGAPNTDQTPTIQTWQNTQTQTIQPNPAKDFWEAALSGVKTVGLWILLIIVIIVGTRILRYLINKACRYGYAFFNSRRLIFLKVLLPRGDGKVDREQEKELAKDMKEKIWRMSQVFNNLHKMGDVSTKEKMMGLLFGKQKLVFIYQYEEGQINFIVGTYPEYQHMIESAIASQYASASIERISRPKFFQKKYHDIEVLEPEKDPLYTIKLYKNIPDDPINNILDSIGKVSPEDTVSIIMTIKPEGSDFNARRQVAADRLYKNLSLYELKWRHRKNLVRPRKLLGFLWSGPSDKLVSSKNEEDTVTMVRMVKAKEDSRNAMGEEAANPTFHATLSIVASSNTPGKPKEILNNLEGAYNVYSDEYSNALTSSNTKHDIFGWFYLPLRTVGIRMFLTGFFSKYCYFSTNELASLFHFPDGTYNRSPAIEWMQYKVIAPPSNLPMFSDEGWNGRVISGVVAENYKKWDVSTILKEYEHTRSVGSRTDIIEELQPISQFSQWNLADKEIIEKDGQKMVKIEKEKKVRGYKIFKDGVLLGVNIYRNVYSPVYIKRDDRTRHHYCIGKSGTGKSVFLQTLARQDIWNGDGLCLIDPHGDLAEDMLAYVPKERAKDVVYFEAGDEERPMGLNLYEIDNLDQADRTVNDATEIFLKMFGPEIFGPRIQEYFKYGSLTLLEDFEDRPTLLDVTRLFTDDGYREFKLKKVTNAVVKNWWEKTYNAMGDREKQEIIPYFSSKFVSFNTNRLIRNIIGQTKSAFKFDDIMNNQKILLINLSKGKIGEMNAQLLGMIIVSKIYNSAMARASMDAKDRKDFYLYVDEFQNFVSGTFADILSEARKYRLGLIMAHQYIAQLDPAKGLGDSGGGKSDVKAAVFGNVGTMMSFKVGAPDAEFLEKEYAPVLGPQDIVGIANYKAYLKLNIDNSTTRVFSMNSIFTKDYQNKKIVPILKEYSAKKYGRRREFVDAETRARLWLGIDETELPDAPSEENQVSDASSDVSQSEVQQPENTESQPTQSE